jgi:hypothetical protein
MAESWAWNFERCDLQETLEEKSPARDLGIGTPATNLIFVVLRPLQTLEKHLDPFLNNARDGFVRLTSTSVIVSQRCPDTGVEVDEEALKGSGR